MFVVVRSYGRYGHDFLHAWDDRWGTTCIGAEKLAMRLPPPPTPIPTEGREQ